MSSSKKYLLPLQDQESYTICCQMVDADTARSIDHIDELAFSNSRYFKTIVRWCNSIYNDILYILLYFIRG